MDLVHRRETTLLPPALEEIAAEIYGHLDRMVLDIGAALQRAFDQHPKHYEAWVTECLPFGLDAARRMRMCWKASLSLPDHVLRALPRPWQALYALTRLRPDVLEEAVAAGRVNPGLTVRESTEVARQLAGRTVTRFTDADIVAGRLMSHPVDALSADVRGMLTDWLEGGEP